MRDTPKLEGPPPRPPTFSSPPTTTAPPGEGWPGRKLWGWWGVQDLVEAGVSLLVVDEVCHLINRQVGTTLSPTERCGGCYEFGVREVRETSLGR